VSKHAKTTITMEYRVFAAMEAKIAELTQELAGIDHAAPAPPAGDQQTAMTRLGYVLDQAVPLVQFAAGNLPASSVAGWPHLALRNLGMYLSANGRDQNERETGQAFLQLAREQADLEQYRHERAADAKQILGIAADDG
jgi:hypothetical protein